MEFEVIRSNRKSMAVEIKLNKLIIRAPMQASNEEINSFMLKNKAWIEKHLAKAQAQQQVAASVQHLFPVKAFSTGAHCNMSEIVT